jgi:hypothetical protein
MGLGTTHLTKSIADTGKFIPELWSMEILRATESNLVLADKVKRYDSMVKNKGDVLYVPNISNLTANAKVAETQVTLQAPTETANTINIDQHYETSMLIEDIAKVQSQYNLMSEYTNKAGYAIAKTIDSSIAGLYSGLSQYVGDGNTDINDTNVIRAIQYLDDADAPEADRFFIVKPSGKADLQYIDKFVLRTGPGWSPDNSPILKNMSNGFWGDLYGVKVYVSTNLVTQAATPSVVHSLMFQKEAFALAIQQQPRTQSQYKQEYLADLLTVDVIYGFAELRDTFGVDFRAKV